MPDLIVVTTPKDWPFAPPPDVEVVPAREYLTDERFSRLRGARVFNLCRSLTYQSIGYYVSLLAMARGHKILPGISTLQDLRLRAVSRLLSDNAYEEVQRSLKPIHGGKFTLSVYFGRNIARRHERLAAAIFRLFPAPLIRAEFEYDKEEEEWNLRLATPIGFAEVPNEHRPFIEQAANEFFQKKGSPRTETAHKPPPYQMAILIPKDPEDPRPSNEGALRKIERAAERAGFGVEQITKDDYARLAEFDALFIRETTSVMHHTYRFARRALAEGAVVMDDPDSIVKCTNKVYLAELLERYKIPTPKTIVVHSGNLEEVANTISMPCVLKQPDSAFSLGVLKADTKEELREKATQMLEESDLIIVQEFFPSEYDWRVGVLDRKPLFAAKYHMAKGHWQIAKRDDTGDVSYGKIEAMPVELAPRHVIELGLKAANLIGDGLYGVDLKQVGKKAVVMEVNDNPNLDHGFEDSVLKDQLWDRIIGVFLERVRKRKELW